MTQLIFTFKNAWNGVFSKKVLSLIILLALTVGFIYPIITFSRINEAYNKYSLSYYQDSANTVVADVFINPQPQEIIQKEIDTWAKNIVNSGFFAINQTTIEYEKERSSEIVTGFSSGYLKVGKTIITKGRQITEQEIQSGARVCIVNDNFARSGKTSFKIGDSLTIEGTEFEIVGFFRDSKVYGVAFLPYNAFYKWFEGSSIQTQSKIFIQTENEPAIREVTRAVKNSGFVASKLSIRVGEGLEEEFKGMLADIYIKILLIGGLIISFSLISFALIIIGKIMNEQYVLGVKIAMGATKWQLFWDLLLQNFFYMQGSCIVAMTIVGLVSKINSEIGGIFGLPVLLASEIMCLVLVIFITIISVMPMLKTNVINMLKNKN